MRLGVVGDPQQALAGTLSGLRRLRDRFSRARVTAVVVLGGLDPAPDGSLKLLRRLRGPWPLLVLPGDRIAHDAFHTTVAQVGPRAVDLSLARIAALPAALLVSVPGYFRAHYLLAKERGCGYGSAEIARLLEVTQKLPGPKLLLSHGPPRGRGAAAVDRAFGGINIGDPQLTRLMAAGGIRFGLFAHVHEAAGHATTLDGAPVTPSSWSDSLLLNVGSADGVPHERIDGSWSAATAALFEIRGRRARYEMIALPHAHVRDLKSRTRGVPAPTVPSGKPSTEHRRRYTR